MNDRGNAFPLADVPGVHLIGSRVLPSISIRAYTFRFDDSAGSDTATAVVASVYGARSLSFLDADCPTAANSRALICAVRHEGRFLVKYGEQGWSTNWFPASVEQVVRYLQLCLRFHGPQSDEPCSIDEPVDPEFLDQPYQPVGKVDRRENSKLRWDLTLRLGDPSRRRQYDAWVTGGSIGFAALMALSVGVVTPDWGAGGRAAVFAICVIGGRLILGRVARHLMR
jgi:hypothetical protein